MWMVGVGGSQQGPRVDGVFMGALCRNLEPRQSRLSALFTCKFLAERAPESLFLPRGTSGYTW